MSTGTEGYPGAGGQAPSEEELRAAYEEEIKKIRAEHVLLEHVVTMVNLGMRRTGLAPGTEGERDPDQVRVAIESVRALMPLIEQVAAPQAGPIRDALSQLQLAYVRIGGAPTESPAGADLRDAPRQAAQGPPPPAEGAPPAGGAPSAGQAPPPGQAPPSATPGEPGPAQRSGRLWVPGQ